MIKIKVTKKENDLIQLIKAEERLKAMRARISILINIIDNIEDDMPECAEELQRELTGLKNDYNYNRAREKALKYAFIKKYREDIEEYE